MQNKVFACIPAPYS